LASLARGFGQRLAVKVGHSFLSLFVSIRGSNSVLQNLPMRLVVHIPPVQCLVRRGLRLFVPCSKFRGSSSRSPRLETISPFRSGNPTHKTEQPRASSHS